MVAMYQSGLFSNGWASPVHMFPEKTRGWRPCGAYRALNLQSLPSNISDFAPVSWVRKPFLRSTCLQPTIRFCSGHSEHGHCDTFRLRSAAQSFQRLLDNITLSHRLCYLLGRPARGQPSSRAVIRTVFGSYSNDLLITPCTLILANASSELRCYSSSITTSNAHKNFHFPVRQTLFKWHREFLSAFHPLLCCYRTPTTKLPQGSKADKPAFLARGSHARFSLC